MLHALKTQQPHFDEVVFGNKTFEVRKADRPFNEGDDIVLQEWDEDKKSYTGEEWKGAICYVMNDPKFVKNGFVILGIKAISK